MDPMSGFDIRLEFTLPSETVHCSTKDAYTSEITFLALWGIQSWDLAHLKVFTENV